MTATAQRAVRARGGSSERLAGWLLPVVTGLVVLSLGFVAGRFRPEDSTVAVWWPAAGVAVAAYAEAWRRRRHRVGVLAAVLLGVLGAELLAGYSVPVSVSYAVANLANPVVCVALLSRWLPTLRVREARDYAKLLLAAFAAAAVTAGIAALVVRLLVDSDAGATFRAVLPSHLSAILVIAPVALLSRRRAPAGRTETVLQATATVLVTVYALAPWQQLPLAFLCLGFLIWGAARVPSGWLYAEVVLFSGIAAVFATIGGGGYQATLEVYHLAPETLATLLDTMLAGVALAVWPLALAMDVHRSSLAEVRHSRELLDSVLAGATGTAIIGAELDGTITSWNAGAEQVFGWSGDEVRGSRSLGSLRGGPLHAVDVTFDRLVAPLLEDSAWVDEDWDCVRQDGSPFTFSVRVTARRSADGAVTGWIAVGRDVTGKRQAEQALLAALDRERQAVLRLEELDAVKSSFVQTASHELRTPMTSILGYTDVLLGERLGELNDPQRKMLGAVSRNGRRLLTLIEDLLTLSQVEQQAFTGETDPLDLRAAVQKGCEVVAAASGPVRLEVDLGPDPVPVLGDGEQLERLTVNLLGNAVKFSPAGSLVRVTVDREEGEAVLTVTDPGMGIPCDEVSRLFERFYRSSNARRAEVPGSGLGLAIVKEVVVHHGGEVEVASEEGVGTTVRVRLPLQAPALRSSRPL